LVRRALILLYAGIAILLCLSVKRPGNRLIWGPRPLINNKYWSAALREAGWESETFVNGFYPNFRRSDFDLYFEDVVPEWIWPRRIRRPVTPYFAFLHIVRNAKVFHLPMSGGPLGETSIWRWEAPLLKRAGIKTVVIPYGGDAYLYSRIADPTLRHALLQSYPRAARDEEEIEARVRYWTANADVTFCATMVDGIGRWDLVVPSALAIDIEEWQPQSEHSNADGSRGVVRVVHTPNHRGFKGTEFIVRAVEELRAEGLLIELVLLELVANETVRRVMPTMDILAEQLLAPGYGLSAVEGMASGLPVLSNLERRDVMDLFRRYSFLDQCPIVSTTPETIKENIRALATNPALRKQLGRAGRAYVEAYHSYENARYMFGAIYEKVLDGKAVDLMNLYHPLKGGANLAKVDHPLVEGRLPELPLADPAPSRGRLRNLA
jgi:glycosyltransferase involved in cell wall biosynthesis